ncbi:MAG TPA: ferrochelatase, partial [Myxococcota bacterium]|nr:ferrochelatase [Myxococcota bacterium]
MPERAAAAGAGEVRTGVLLVNLGTPDAPRPAEVRRYLREFLGDPRVLDMPALSRWLLLHLVILPQRPRASARAYAKVWTPEGSPLAVHTARQAMLLAEKTGLAVEYAMRYGEPTIGRALSKLD